MENEFFVIIDNITDEYLSSVKKDADDIEVIDYDWNGGPIDNPDCEYIEGAFLFSTLKEAKKMVKILERDFTSFGEEIDFEIQKVVKTDVVKIVY